MTELETRAYNHADATIASLATEPRPNWLLTRWSQPQSARCCGRIGLTVQPVILAGGAGTRMWPLSRELYPKQFLSLTGKRSMLQETISLASAASER